jgi:hypothetical protein
MYVAPVAHKKDHTDDRYDQITPKHVKEKCVFGSLLKVEKLSARQI